MRTTVSEHDCASKASRTDDDVLIERIRGEFLEMPGLCLTPPQAARLLALDHETSQELLRKLSEAGFLRLTGNGAYVRKSNT